MIQNMGSILHKKEKKRRVELLAPAGSLACMEAAVKAGADAVYMGGPRFGARAYAENPETDELVWALDYLHLRGKKLYLTVNTLLKPGELPGLYDYLLPFYEAGVDAVLVQDLGVLRQIRRDFPDLPVHASTQMTVMDADGALALKQLGLTRVVTAREVTLREMKAIADTGVELEVFAHGAICYCYSGQCLLSSLIGGRSGNRGRCAQPCRLPYEVLQDGKRITPDDGYVLNLKDMDTLSCLPQILETGAVSLKLEGRMKSPRYTGGVTAVYRKYIDRYLSGEKYRVDPEDRRFLRELFDRGGYTEYATAGLHDGMVAAKKKPDFRAADEAFLQSREASFPVYESKEKLKGKVRFYVGEPVIMTVETTGADSPAVNVTVYGETVQTAKNRPMNEETLRSRFSRLGETPFVWEELSVETDGRGFLPVGCLNELRREAMAQAEQKLLAQYHCRKTDPSMDKATDEPVKGERGRAETAGESIVPDRSNPGRPAALPGITVAVDTLEQLQVLAEYTRSWPQICRVYLNSATLTQAQEREALGLIDSLPPLYLNLPAVLRLSMKEQLEKNLPAYEAAGVAGYLVHTLDEAAWLKRILPQAELQADASLYSYNAEAAELLKELGLTGATLPAELNKRELAARMEGSPLPAELILYGYQTSMISAQCVHRTTTGCDGRPGLLYLKDRKGKQFAVRNCCRYCLNVIYNSEPLYLADCRSEWNGLDLEAVRLQFTIENEKGMRRILDTCLPALTEGRAADNPLQEFTRGHFKRGVE